MRRSEEGPTDLPAAPLKRARTAGAVLLILTVCAAAAVAFSVAFGPLYSTVNGPNTQSVTLTVDRTVSGSATLNLTLYGDLDFSAETLTVTIDGVAVGVVNGLQCGVFTRSLTIPAGTLAPLVSDGQIVLGFTSTSDVNVFCAGTAPPFASVGAVGFAVQGTLTFGSAPAANWTITSSAAPATFASEGQAIIYSYTLTNTGPGAINSIAVTGTKTGIIRCPASSLAGGASMTCASSYTTAAADARSDISYDAVATGAPASGSLSNATTNGRVAYAPQPELSVSAAPSPATFGAAGEAIAHRFQVTNIGNVSVAALALAGTRTGAISCPQTTLAPGQQTACTSTDTTTAADLGAGIAFAATATGTPEVGSLTGVTVTGTIGFTSLPALGLSVTTSPEFSRPRQTITYTFRVTNSGNVGLTAIAVADSVVRDIACPVTTLALGAAASCTGSYTTTAADVAAGRVISVATATGMFVAAAVSSPAVTTELRVDAEAIRATTQAAIRNFMNHRADMIVSMSPDLSAMHERLTGSLFATGASARAGSRTAVIADAGVDAGAHEDGHPLLDGSSNTGRQAAESGNGLVAALPFQMAGNGTSRTGRASFAMSRATLRQAGQRAPARTSDTGDPAALDWNIWAEGAASWFEYDAADSLHDGDGGVLYVGADRRIRPAVLVGGLVQFDWMSETSAAIDLDASGRGWMAGPYVSMRPTPALFVDARAAWGTSSNDVDPLGVYTDEFSTHRTLVSAKVTGRWPRGSFSSRPNAEIAYFRDTQNGYTNVIGVSIPGQSSSLGRLTFGPELAYAITWRSNVTLEPYAGFDAVWDFARTADRLPDGTELERDRLRGRVELGTSARSVSGLTLGAAFSYDGIGSALRATRARFWVVVPIN